MPKTPLHNEKVLVCQLADGDRAAFNTLVDHYWNKLYQVSLTYIKSPPAAEDVVQDIFLKLWQKREKLGTVESLENYLFIVTRNEVLSAMRKRGPVQSIDSLVSGAEPSTTSGAEELVTVKRLQALLHTAVGLLPPQQQMAWKLRDQGLSQQEIAAEMGIAKNTVKIHIVRALSFLRTYLQAHSDIVMSIAITLYLQKF